MVLNFIFGVENKLIFQANDAKYTVQYDVIAWLSSGIAMVRWFRM